MALSTYTGSFTQPITTNATFAVTGPGFTPKALILYATDETAIGITTGLAMYMGMAASTSSRAAVSSTQTTATNTGSRAHNSSKCFIAVNPAGTTVVAADFVSFNSNGFTLNFSTVDTNARIISYIALGGSDLTAAFVKAFLPASSTGNQSFTGVGFKPSAVFMMSAQVAGTTETDTGATGWSLGWSNGTTQAALEMQNNGATESVQKTTTIIEKSSSGGSITTEANLVSLDSDGFTIDQTNDSSVKEFFALCLEGGQYATGSLSQKTSTGSQAVTGLAFQPTGLLMMSWNLASSTSINTSTSRSSFGSASGSSNMSSIWSGGGNGGVQDHDTDTGELIKMYTESATPTLNAAATLTSFDSAGFTLNWGNADTTARQVLYFAMGSNAVVTTATSSNLMTMGMG